MKMTSNIGRILGLCAVAMLFQMGPAVGNEGHENQRVVLRSPAEGQTFSVGQPILVSGKALGGNVSSSAQVTIILSAPGFGQQVIVTPTNSGFSVSLTAPGYPTAAVVGVSFYDPVGGFNQNFQRDITIQ